MNIGTPKQSVGVQTKLTGVAPSGGSGSRSRSSRWSRSPPPGTGSLCGPSRASSACSERRTAFHTLRGGTGTEAAGCAARTCGLWAACSSGTGGRSRRTGRRRSSGPSRARGWRAGPGWRWCWRPPRSRPRSSGTASRRCGWGRAGPGDTGCRRTFHSRRGHMRKV